MTVSHDLFVRAKKVIPGGVNSPVRACLGVGAEPLFIESAFGSKMRSVDGRQYIDYVMSWGPMLLGHAHPEVIEAACAAAARGSSFGAPCEAEVVLAEMVCEAVPGIEMARMVSSGTEAAMSALRLARAATGRNRIVKFEGCYHGHADAFLASAGSGVATLSIPGTPGVPEDTVRHTLLAPFNDLAAVGNLFEVYEKDIAAVFVEPVAGNIGLVPPAEGFLQGLRDLCTKHGALLVFDEVITGFRMAYGGAQSVFGVVPDLTCLGKIIGGGFPVGAYGGRRSLMENIAPEGGVYQAGTLSGNPVAMAAGIATLKLLAKADYAGLAARTERLARELARILEAKGAPVVCNVMASAFTLFFAPAPVTDYETAKAADSARYASYYRSMREAGVMLAPSGFECAFTSFAHTEEDYAATVEAARAARL
ncbi:MAG: glutamate-1-semialdehyde 2,1-aminomutase [Desulfovibrionaceae bacterium]|nr:glutamate-1-semialdehyde 2,1-aminomutase [Desulfovibrionaceae bacterium]MBF0514879.1 glutamate-1-semialdehyde 2,1-aminomutase [Desulfovibrionaceae bacterium]